MLKKRFRSFRFALAGLRDLFKTQPNARIHLLMALMVIAAGFFWKIALVEWGVLVLTITLVLAAEAFNTALEYLTNLVSPDYHPLAGKTKDVAAAGVLICAVGAVCVGLVIFGPRLWQLLISLINP